MLTPHSLDYRVQFPGPGGTNAVEAALKLARKVTGRHTVAYFQRGFHGMTLGALAVTANPAKRAGAGAPLPHTVPVPFDDPADDEGKSVARLVRSMDGVAADGPLAAVVVQTFEGEGGETICGVWRVTCTSSGRRGGGSRIPRSAASRTGKRRCTSRSRTCSWALAGASSHRRPEEIDDGVSLAAELGQFGPGGRALYDPRPGDPSRWDRRDDSP